MNKLKHIISSFLLFSVSTNACQILSFEEEMEDYKETKALAIEHAQKAAREANTILKARVVNVTERVNDENRTTKYFDVELDNVDVLKGALLEGQRLFWKENLETITIGCSQSMFIDAIDLMPSYPYLLYIKDGEIIRKNDIGPYFPTLTGEEEIELIGVNGL